MFWRLLWGAYAVAITVVRGANAFAGSRALSSRSGHLATSAGLLTSTTSASAPRGYERLGDGVAEREGAGLGSLGTRLLRRVSLDQCQTFCDNLTACNSFALCGTPSRASCFFKDMTFTGTEPVRPSQWCSTYYAVPQVPLRDGPVGTCEDFCTEKCASYSSQGWCEPTSSHYNFMQRSCCASCANSGAVCGIAVNAGQCDAERAYLSSLDTRAASMGCMGYGGAADPCTLSITNDADFGIAKNPSFCQQDVFFLWDEPDTMCDRGFGSCGPDWASLRWKAYVERWGSLLVDARRRGMKITTPLMKSGSMQVLLQRFSDFFTYCPECNQPNSSYYIDVLAFNAFAVQSPPSPYAVRDQYDYLKSLARGLKAAYPRRPVYATNFGTLFAQQAFDQAAALTSFGMLESATSSIDKVFYFAARDYCGAPDCTTHNFLHDVVEHGDHAGKTLGQVLVEACLPPPAVTSAGTIEGGTQQCAGLRGVRRLRCLRLRTDARRGSDDGVSDAEVSDAGGAQPI